MLRWKQKNNIYLKAVYHQEVAPVKEKWTKLELRKERERKASISSYLLYPGPCSNPEAPACAMPLSLIMCGCFKARQK